MLDAQHPDDLLSHLTQSTKLSHDEAHKLVAEICAYFSESVPDFVARRHQELQTQGLKNPIIYECIASELSAWRFPAPALTERQIRRLIYG